MKKQGARKAESWTTVGTSGEKIADEAYQGNESLVRVEVAEGVTSIGERAFYGCANLESVKIPKSVTKIGEEAFRGCGRDLRTGHTSGTPAHGGTTPMRSRPIGLPRPRTSPTPC